MPDNKKGVGPGESTPWKLIVVCTEQWAGLPKKKNLTDSTLRQTGVQKLWKHTSPFVSPHCMPSVDLFYYTLQRKLH